MCIRDRLLIVFSTQLVFSAPRVAISSKDDANVTNVDSEGSLQVKIFNYENKISTYVAGKTSVDGKYAPDFNVINFSFMLKGTGETKITSSVGGGIIYLSENSDSYDIELKSVKTNTTFYWDLPTSGTTLYYCIGGVK